MPPKNRKNEEARARAQAKREAMRKADQRRKMGLYGLGGGVVVIVVVLIVLFAVVLPDKSKDATKDISQPASAALVADVTTLPSATYEKVGTTGVGQSVAGLKTINDSPITTDGKPTFVYVGGEFCPYCAAERWSIATALSRFGTFSGLEITRSAKNDGNFATLSFVHATYTSKYLVFDGKEILDRARKTLQPESSLGTAAQASYTKYGGGGVPYVTINNAYTTTYQFDPAVLGSMTADEIGAAIKDPSTNISKNVLASANILTAGICAQTKQQPSSVCSLPAVKGAAQYLSTSSSGSGSATG